LTCSFSRDKSFHENSIILDDNLNAWENIYSENLILSKKYAAFLPQEFFDDNQIGFLEQIGLGGFNYSYSYLTDWNQFFLREIYQRFIDHNNCPLSIENSFSKSFQIKYLTDIIQNIFKLSVLKNCN
jgi:hypothetical protein